MAFLSARSAFLSLPVSFLSAASPVDMYSATEIFHVLIQNRVTCLLPCKRAGWEWIAGDPRNVARDQGQCCAQASGAVWHF